MALSNEQILNNFCDMLDKFHIPHNCNGKDLIEIDGHLKIKYDTTFSPWRCKLLLDDTEVYTGHPTGTVLMINFMLRGKKYVRQAK